MAMRKRTADPGKSASGDIGYVGEGRLIRVPKE